MSIGTIFKEKLPKLYAKGEEAVFTPFAGDPDSFNVFIEFNVMLQPSGIEVQVWDRGTTIEMLFSDIGREPLKGEVFTVDGVDYTVKAILENDGFEIKVQV